MTMIANSKGSMLDVEEEIQTFPYIVSWICAIRSPTCIMYGTSSNGEGYITCSTVPLMVGTLLTIHSPYSLRFHSHLLYYKSLHVMCEVLI